jgi:hypothetical protein
LNVFGYGDIGVSHTDPCEEPGDLLADHEVRSARRRGMPVICPFGVVERHQAIEILGLEGLLERREVEPCLRPFIES